MFYFVYIFKCNQTQNCQDKIKISARVTFVDLSIESQYEQARLFKFSNVVPSDFLSPFLGANSQAEKLNTKIWLHIMPIFIIYFLF
jgi:hypothetical protein